MFLKVSELAELLSSLNPDAVVFLAAADPAAPDDDASAISGPVIGVVSRADSSGRDSHVMLVNHLADRDGNISFRGTPSFQRLVIDTNQPFERAEAQAMAQVSTPMKPITQVIEENRAAKALFSARQIESFISSRKASD